MPTTLQILLEPFNQVPSAFLNVHIHVSPKSHS